MEEWREDVGKPSAHQIGCAEGITHNPPAPSQRPPSGPTWKSRLFVPLLWGIGYLFFANQPAFSPYWPSCLSRQLFHINCPLCGGTRALAFLSHGEVYLALLLHPLVTLGAFWLLIGTLGLYYSPLYRRWQTLTERLLNPRIIIALLVLNWALVMRN